MEDITIEIKEKISVIIPSYNRAEIILKSIDSVLNQSYENIELIVVDDGSTDDTKKVLKTVTDDRFKFVTLESNRGMCYARNVGTNLATGKYIAIHDSDDIWHHDKLLLQYEFMESTDADLSFCKMRRISLDGTENVVPLIESINQDNLYAELLKGNFIASITIIMKKELANKIYFDPTVRRFTDWDFALRVVKEGYSVAYLPKILATSYIQEDSSAQNENSYKSLKFIYERFEQDIQNYKESHAVFLYNLGLTSSHKDRKTGSKYYQESLKVKYTKEALLRLIINELRILPILRKFKHRFQ